MIQKTQKIVTTIRKVWQVRLITITYFAALFIAISPIPIVHAPIFQDKAEADTIDYKDYAKHTGQIEYNWNTDQHKCLVKLWGKESAWNPKADNPTSTAFGIAQMLKEDSTNGFVQISNGLRYIEHRYTNPCNAWEFWQRNNWY
jgi:hypothetical protein